MATWPAARYFTAVNNGPGTQTGLNAIQDQFYRAAGITQTDLADVVLANGWGSSNSKLLSTDVTSLATGPTGTASVTTLGSTSITVAAGDLLSVSLITDATSAAGTPSLLIELLVDGTAVTYPHMGTAATYLTGDSYSVSGNTYSYGSGPGCYAGNVYQRLFAETASSTPGLTLSSYMCIPNLSAGAHTISVRATLSGFPTVGVSSLQINRMRAHLKLETY